MKNIISIIFLVILIFLPCISASHYIIGKVNDAFDFTSANDHIIVLWNPANGITDNITDIIGTNGNSATDNIFMLDCELLNTQCDINDILFLQVLDIGDYHNSEIYYINVTGNGYDLLSEFNLNSRPNISLISPTNSINISGPIVNFNCSGEDLDNNLNNLTLFGNWSFGWHANETKEISGSIDSKIFSKSLNDGSYIWNCRAYDNTSLFRDAAINYSFTVDSTPPNISQVYVNQSYSCGTGKMIRVNCNVSDNLVGIGSVIIEANGPFTKTNYSTISTVGTIYYSDINLNDAGIWSFNCFSNDSVGNSINFTSENFIVYSSNAPDFFINSSSIKVNKNFPIEYEEVSINVTVENRGCLNNSLLSLGFYNGDPLLGGTQIGNNISLSIGSTYTNDTNITYYPEIGITNIFVVLDNTDYFSEMNESNNKANYSIQISAWETFYGNVSGEKIMSTSTNISMNRWINLSLIRGNLFVTDKEASVNWLNLKPIGYDITDTQTFDDFSDIDSLLNMAGYTDSVSYRYSDSGVAITKKSFNIYEHNIDNVPIINSTNNSNFVTGILWDITDDHGNNEFDTDDQEDLVFITQINRTKTGAYGNYDYEISYPAKLRQYDPSDSSEVYLYYDLV